MLQTLSSELALVSTRHLDLTTLRECKQKAERYFLRTSKLQWAREGSWDFGTNISLINNVGREKNVINL